MHCIFLNLVVLINGVQVLYESYLFLNFFIFSKLWTLKENFLSYSSRGSCFFVNCITEIIYCISNRMKTVLCSPIYNVYGELPSQVLIRFVCFISYNFTRIATLNEMIYKNCSRCVINFSCIYKLKIICFKGAVER
jgi:hypothetical protein